MKPHLRNIHREVLKRDPSQFSDDPTWYAVWLGRPHAEGSELLGRTERLARPRWWRAFPASGDRPQVKQSWSQATYWLLQVREGHEKTTDTATGTEEESVS